MFSICFAQWSSRTMTTGATILVASGTSCARTVAIRIGSGSGGRGGGAGSCMCYARPFATADKGAIEGGDARSFFATDASPKCLDFFCAAQRLTTPFVACTANGGGGGQRHGTSLHGFERRWDGQGGEARTNQRERGGGEPS